ncbi:MAG: GTP-binding protein [Candidatus Heimdallarchaeota archaeon]|nr:GTP-binding protein [Candidatus Heimdallarchaeota archaeon]
MNIYYDTEKERIEDIISTTKDNETDQKENNSFLRKETFENFFGVTLEDEANKVQQNQNTPKTQSISTDHVYHDANISVERKDKIRSELETVWNTINEEDSGRESIIEVEKINDKVIRSNILLIGDSAVGRTSLRRAWMGKHFVESHLTTIGASIEKKTIEIDNYSFDVTLTDLGGQDFYSTLRRNFYRNVDGAIVVFDLTRPETYRRLEFWVKELYREIKQLVPFIIVGNKSDSKNRKISVEEGEKISNWFSRSTMPKFRVRYLETSAKAGSNVDEIFNVMCKEIKSFKIQQERRENR